MGYSYLLSIYNEKGTEVDSLGASDGDQYKTLQELYELARHAGTRADQILDKLLERVGGVG